MALFESSIKIACTSEAAFEFLTCPANLPSISPPDSNLRIIEAPERFALGSRFEFELGGFGPPQRFIHEISAFNPSAGFSERLVRGPLPLWKCEHLLEKSDNGHIKVVDRIEFRPPGGLVGLLVTEQRILDSLRSAFDFRHQALKALLENGAGSSTG